MEIREYEAQNVTVLILVIYMYFTLVAKQTNLLASNVHETPQRPTFILFVVRCVFVNNLKNKLLTFVKKLVVRLFCLINYEYFLPSFCEWHR